MDSNLRSADRGEQLPCHARGAAWGHFAANFGAGAVSIQLDLFSAASHSMEPGCDVASPNSTRVARGWAKSSATLNQIVLKALDN
jgi:hypothetical protein